MHNFNDYFNFSPNLRDNFFGLNQISLQENYYKQLSESLQKKINILEAKIKKKKKKMANKDYDGDGKIESSKDEYFGSKDKAIKAAMKKKKTFKEGREVVGGGLIYGGFPKKLNESKKPLLGPDGIEFPSEAFAALYGEFTKARETFKTTDPNNPNFEQIKKTHDTLRDRLDNHPDSETWEARVVDHINKLAELEGPDEPAFPEEPVDDERKVPGSDYRYLRSTGRSSLS